jgi:uncharacterized membrane protein
MSRVLLVGESWFKHTLELKGFDSYSFGAYEVGTEWISAALRDGGHEFTHLPSHLVDSEWPNLTDFDVILISDVGANTFLLGSSCFVDGQSGPNKLQELADYVRNGGGLGMIGGYLSFAGIEGKAHYASTAIEDVLPVTISHHDDRVESPEGVQPEVLEPNHPIVAGIETLGPLLGFNAITAKSGATVIATLGEHPLLAIWTVGEGRAFAYSSDCGPHWASRAYIESKAFARLWCQLVSWAHDGGAPLTKSPSGPA